MNINFDKRKETKDVDREIQTTLSILESKKRKIGIFLAGVC